MSDLDAYTPIGDYALIGDCHSAALISRQGSIEWCCLPRFDSGSAFGRLLDRHGGGHCSVAPADDGPWEYVRTYLEDTLVLETTLLGPGGEARLLDCFTVRGSPAVTLALVTDDSRWQTILLGQLFHPIRQRTLFVSLLT